MSTMNICIDFDGTIAEEPFELFPECGELRYGADEVIQRLEARGFTLSLWTCRTGVAATKCKEFLKKHQIPYHYFNEHSKESIERYGTSEGKKISGIYIDNQNLEYKLNGMPTWDQLEIMINQLKYE